MIFPVYVISRNFLKISLKILCGLEVTGKKNLPRKGAFIVASNHVSFIDPPVAGSCCDTVPVAFMAKKELFEIPLLGLWFSAMGCIPVDRKSGSFRPLKQALEKLKKGKPIGIFPEGTRSENGKFQKAELGMGFLAYKSGAPIIPVYISGTDRVLPKGQRFMIPHKIRALIGKPVDIGESLKLAGKEKIYESIGEKVMAAISRLKDEEKNSRRV